MWRELDTRHFATQWPCPDEFHVPLGDEWTQIHNMWVSLWAWSSTWYSDMSTKLKLPLCSWLKNKSWTKDTGAVWYYYSSTHSQYANGSLCLTIGGGLLVPNSFVRCAYGCSIRAFKNMPSVPDSNRTTIYQWTWIAWIFYNSSEWLISISSDWTAWITIADKNLWATTVWNNGNTLTASNCGWYYQWGNNYMFPFSWATTTSSTQVNASSYWPWNYYSSSTFILNSWTWDSSDSKNLRWWEDGNVPV